MILGGAARATAERAPGAARASLDEVFRHLAARNPDALALADPPNRRSFTDGEPRRLSYGEADRVVSAIAARLQQMGLPTDSTVGVQLPNTVEHIVAILGVLRAGMIAAPLPLLWRRADTVTALARIGAKAVISCGHVGGVNYALPAMQVAAEVFSVRYVCAFGTDLPDGVVPFDDLFAAAPSETVAPPERDSHASAHVAIITFDVGESGPVAVARSHGEVFAGGLAVLLEGGLKQNTNIISAYAPASFAGVSLTLVPWLLSGGTLVLHHPFDPEIFDRQRRELGCATLILPGTVAMRLPAAHAPAGAEPATVIAAWRAPESVAVQRSWPETDGPLVDVSIYGEAALAPARRTQGGRPRPLAAGPLRLPRDGAGGVVVAEFMRTEAGTLAVRGPMVPLHAFPPGIERAALPRIADEHGVWIDTGYGCRAGAAGNGLAVIAPPDGIVTVGGCRFPLRDLREVASRIDRDASVAALPDPVLGQRLIGNAADRATMQAALTAVGVHPLVVEAFRDRGGEADASAEAG